MHLPQGWGGRSDDGSSQQANYLGRTNRLPVDTTPIPDSTAMVLADFSQIAVTRDPAASVKILE